MAATCYTPDGKCHVLLRSDALEQLIYEYAGADAARIVHNLTVKAKK